MKYADCKEAHPTFILDLVPVTPVSSHLLVDTRTLHRAVPTEDVKVQGWVVCVSPPTREPWPLMVLFGQN